MTKDLERQLQAKPEWLLKSLLEEETLEEALNRVPKVRLIAFDLDGTLLTSDKRITERSKGIIQKLAQTGIIMMPCTGRPTRNTKELLEQMGLNKAVILHGAGFYNLKTDKTLYRYTFATTEVLEDFRAHVSNLWGLCWHGNHTGLVFGPELLCLATNPTAGFST